ncbi:MAG: hypothetical protein AB1498_12165 [bacterium]
MVKQYKTFVGLGLVFVFLILGGTICMPGDSPAGSDYTPTITASPLEGCAPLAVTFRYTIGSNTEYHNINGASLDICGPADTYQNLMPYIQIGDYDVVVTFSVPGTYTAAVTINYNGGRTGESQAVTITVRDCDTATITDTTDADTTATDDTTFSHNPNSSLTCRSCHLFSCPGYTTNSECRSCHTNK